MYGILHKKAACINGDETQMQRWLGRGLIDCSTFHLSCPPTRLGAMFGFGIKERALVFRLMPVICAVGHKHERSFGYQDRSFGRSSVFQYVRSASELFALLEREGIAVSNEARLRLEGLFVPTSS